MLSRQSFDDEDLNYYNTTPNSRRRSIGYDDAPVSPRRRSNSIISELEVMTIPADTRLHLWDIKSRSITDPHFVSSGELRVLIKRGHGPLYGYIQQLLSSNSSQLWDETKDALRSVPLVKNFMHDSGHIHSVMSRLRDQYDVDALFMAYTNDGKVGLYFVHHGNDPDIHLLR